MKNAIREFITYLHNIKQTSNNTEISYERDLNKMAAYLERQGVYNPLKVTETDLNGYLSYLRRNKFAASTISRSVASIRAFYQFLFRAHQIVQDPSENLKPPKVEKKTPEDLDRGRSGFVAETAFFGYGKGAERQGDAGVALCDWDACQRAHALKSIGCEFESRICGLQ